MFFDNDDYDYYIEMPVVIKCNSATSVGNNYQYKGNGGTAIVPNITAKAVSVPSTSDANVIQSGTPENPHFTFEIPKGQDGVNGLTPHIGENGNWWIGDVDTGVSASSGADGKSAYEIAVENGFVGTEQEWLDSLVGADGKDGVDGTDGLNGENGKSAYEVAVDNGFEGTETEWLESIKGADGTNGTDGKSAYEIWLDEGHTGTEEDFLEWLKGTGTNSGYLVFSNGSSTTSILKSETINRHEFIGSYDYFTIDFANRNLDFNLSEVNSSERHNIPIPIPKDGKVVAFTFYGYALSIQANVPTTLVAQIWINRKSANDNIFRPHPANIRFIASPTLQGGQSQITTGMAMSIPNSTIDVLQGDRIIIGLTFENSENIGSMSVHSTVTLAIEEN